MRSILIAIFASLLTVSNGAKILVVASLPAHSHFTLALVVARELAAQGHEISFINPYPQQKPIENLRDISVESNVQFFNELKKKLMSSNDASFRANMNLLFDLTNVNAEKTLQHPNVQKLLNSDEHFDLIIIEHFINDAIVGLGYRFDAPVIFLYSQGLNSTVNKYFGNPFSLAYMPNRASPLTKNMNFWQRLRNSLETLFFDQLINHFVDPEQRRLFHKYFVAEGKNKSTTAQPTLDQVLRKYVSLMFLNSHVSLSDPAPLVPGIIEIGGFHVQNDTRYQKLPEDLQKYLDESKDGVVLFSLGSNLKSSDLSPEVRDGIMRAFSKIKQNVLWKFEDDDLPGKPDNVKIVKWLPQAAILAHRNVRAFITHGGLLSLIETIYYGVPIIGIPVFGDQLGNVASAVEQGYGLRIELKDLAENTLSEALKEILHNPKYRDEAQIRSKLMHDRPMKPLDLAVYWIEHVIRHKGAKHLRSAALDLNWFQREMLDVALFIFVIITSLIASVIFIVIKIKNCLCGKKADLSKYKKFN